MLQLVKVLDHWTEILEWAGCIDVIYCDFMKVFDKVLHRPLAQKPNYYGVEDPVLKWIKAFPNRKQRVVANRETSAWHNVPDGILQEFVLAPILFVIYINTLPEMVQDSEVFLFANDTKAFKIIITKEACVC